MAIEVRRVTARDAERLKVVRLSALADSPSAFGSTFEREARLTDEEWSERARSSATGNSRATFFAVDGDDVAGLVVGNRANGSVSSVELVSMWVDQRYRRCGLGRRLVDAAVRWSVDTGATAIGLWVTRGNEPAEELYRALGFAATDEFQPLPSDPCREELRMELRLTTEGSVTVSG